jgi:aspartate aminotransferase-like enzyme
MSTVHEFGRFFLPGPTDIRPEVLVAQAGPPLPHRGAAFERLFASLQPGLQQVFGTARPVYVSTSSATGLMEAAVRCAKPGPILSLVNGAFAERFADIARSCGRDVTVLDASWGRTVPLEQVEQALRERAYAGVTVVHSETSTGALAPLAEFGALCRTHGALSLVDSVTGVAGADMQTDAWQLDFVFTGSQKALAMPPGLAFGVASERYLATAHEAPARGRYFDVLEFEQYIHKHQTPNTPAVSLLYAAATQLAYIEQETIAVRVQRHRAMAERTQAWVADTRESLGIPLCIQALDGERSPTVTCIALPVHIAGEAVVKGAAARGYVIGGGYGKLKATHVRIGHMGDHTLHGLDHCLAVVHDSLAELVR